jgi:predicted oxidoreductase
MSKLSLSPEPRPLVKSHISTSNIAWGQIAWGMWRFTEPHPDSPRARVEAAFAAGVTLFDTADIYGTDEKGNFGSAEALLGQVLQETPHLREKMVLASKGGIWPGTPYNSSHEYLTQAIDDSLRRLRTEHIDLWQIHRPDILTHPAEIAQALEAAHKAGKIGAVGVSNYTAAQLAALQAHMSLPIVVHQIEFSPLEIRPLHNGTIDQALERDMVILAWSPLGGGRLSHAQDARGVAVAAALDAVAHSYGVSRAAAAYSWIMAHPARPIPIVGTQSVARIAEIPSAFKVEWTRELWYAVLEAALGEKLP